MGRKKIIGDEALLEHARAVFLERGAFGTTKDIAKRAGISEAVIFKRFPTKANLFLAAMMPPNIDANTIIASEIEDTPAALVETGYRLLHHFRKIIPPALHLMAHPTIKMSEIIEHFGDDEEVTNHLTDFLQERSAQGHINTKNPMAAASLLVAAIHSLALYEIMEMHGGQDMEHAVPFFVGELWAGLQPRPAEADDP